MLPRFGLARVLWFVLLICAVSAFDVDHAEAEEGLASWYGPGLEGKPTAGGVPYDPNGHAAASTTLPPETRLLAGHDEHAGSVAANDREPFVADRDPDPSQEAAQVLGHTKVSVSSVEYWEFANLLPREGIASEEPGSPQELLQLTKVGVSHVEDWRLADPNPPQGVASQEPGLPRGAVQQTGLPQGTARQLDSSQGAVQDEAGGGDYVVQPEDTLSEIASRSGTSVDHLAGSNGIADPSVIYSGQALRLLPNGIDSTFIRGQEGFRLDGYVPDLGSSRSGVTIGTGVDLGQMSVAGMEALDIPRGLKQKLRPYAGLTGQDAARFLNNHPLHLTEEEANVLDRVVTQNTIEGVAHRFDTAAPGNLFAELPPEARTVVADIAHQYGPDLTQRMPNFWSDMTEGRWETVVQKLRNFGDRYPTRRNAEADLLQRAIERGAFRHYVVQPGDSLPEIASRLGTSVDDLTRSNSITDPDIVYNGQALYY